MIQRFLATRVGRFVQAAFSVYVVIWALAEPLNLTWITSHPLIWRVILIGVSVIIGLTYFVNVIGSVLEKIDSQTIGKRLQDFISTGSPVVRVSTDGHVGEVMTIQGDYTKDELDWPLLSSAQKAKTLEFRFKHTALLYFYLRVVVRSQNGQGTKTVWIRFDNNLGEAEVYEPTKSEMGLPYDSVNDGSMLKTRIDIKQAVKDTYGQGGWQLEKSTLFRIRGQSTVTVKDIKLIR